jgi:hypothetical protein
MFDTRFQISTCGIVRGRTYEGRDSVLDNNLRTPTPVGMLAA